jgi:predicted DNA-binding transcriptional regulator AlpA
MRSVADLVATLKELPQGTLLPAAGVLEMLQGCGPVAGGAGTAAGAVATVPAPWAERIWTVPDQTQLSADQCAEAIGRSRSALYQLTRRGRIPHGKRDGVLVFQAAAIRAWLEDETETITRPREPFEERTRKAG